MKHKRFFVADRLGTDLVLDGTEHHHLANVLRARADETVILCNGDLFDYMYKIEDINRDETVLRFLSRSKNRQNPKTKLVVFQAIIKLDNLALVVEKLNELGVSEFVPFVSKNSNMPVRSVNISKLQTIANQSCKQCGRSVPLKIHEVHDFDEMLAELPKFDNAFYADRGEKSRSIQYQDLQDSSYNAIVVGPEGGLTLEENLALADAATPVTLGKRTLRAETAAIASATVVLHYLAEI